jgi:hypothetical protein
MKHYREVLKDMGWSEAEIKQVEQNPDNLKAIKNTFMYQSTELGMHLDDLVEAIINAFKKLLRRWNERN